MAVRIQFRRGTAAEWTSANPTLAAGELGYETDTAKFKLGDGSTAWTSLDYGGINQGDIDNAIANVIDSSPDALNTLNELAAALNDDADFYNTIVSAIATAQTNAQTYAYDLQVEHSSQTTNVHGISNTANLVYESQIADFASETYVANAISDHNQETANVHGIDNTLELMTATEIDSAIDGALSTHESDTTSVHGIANTAELATNSDVSSSIETHNQDATNVHGIANTALLALGTDITNAITAHDVTTNVHGIANTAELVTTSDLTNTLTTELADYATIDGQTFTGNVTLPSSTSIGDVDSSEIAYLNGVTSAIQTQLDAKLASATASSTYAPLSGPTFTGTVSLPATTSIGDVSATEIGYVDGVTSAIQTQLDAKLASATASSTYAPIDSPTFTTAATLPAQTDIGDVSATEIGYLDGVTSAIQTQIDAKAPIANATFTGSTEAVDLTLTGNLYVQGSTTTISTSNLKLRDNMTYLNQAGAFDLSGASGDGTNVIYTTSTNHDYAVGDFVTVANTTPSSFDIGAGDGVEILAITDNTFTVASSVTDTYTSGGDARGKIHANPDLGWAAGRYTANTYAHAGFFRDATDGTFKVFDGYVPEPDESAFIDTSHNTFALADFAAATVTAANVVATTGVTFADNTVQTSAGVPSLTSFTEKTASYTLDTLDHQDNVVEMNSGSAMTFTIPTNSSLAWPVGASMDIIQTGSGQVTISPDSGVTLNYTPGNKLRTQWSSCTIMKRATDSWIVYGDLTA